MSLGLANRIVGAESGGNATAKNPNSSATGAGQFIDSTWLDMVGRYRPDLAGAPRDQVLALRNDPVLSREMVQNYAEENGAKLRAAGLPDNDGTRYLSHVVGPGGARSVLSADPTTPLAQVLPANALAANRFMQPMSAGDLTRWAARKVGDAAPSMTMPGETAAPGRFGLAGPTQAAAPYSMAPAGGAPMTMPEASAKETGPDYGALLRAVAGQQGLAALAQPQAATAAPSRLPAAPTRRPVAFDLDAFLGQMVRGSAR